jgi:hypothetical protein
VFSAFQRVETTRLRAGGGGGSLSDAYILRPFKKLARLGSKAGGRGRVGDTRCNHLFFPYGTLTVAGMRPLSGLA